MTGAAAAGSVFAPVLARLAADADKRYGVSGLQLIPVAFHERPFSHVVRLRVQASADRPPLAHLFAKVLKPKDLEGGMATMRRRIEQDFAATLRAQQVLNGHPDLAVVPPVACYPDLLAIVTEEVVGQTLLEHLEKEARWFPGTQTVQALEQTLARAGRWIKAFQVSDEDHGFLSATELRDYIDQRLQYLVADAGHRFSPAIRQQVLALIDRLGESVSAEELRKVPIHADLALGNVLVSDGKIVVLDFAMAQTGCRLHDLARLFVQIDQLRAKPYFRNGTVKALQRALLSGYDPALTVNAPILRLLVLLHRVNNLATVLLGRRVFVRAIYDRRLERIHRQWIDAQLSPAKAPVS